MPDTEKTLEEREEELLRRARELDEREGQVEAREKNLKEKIYDKINIPIWALDIIIGLCFAGIVYCLIAGKK